MAKIVTAEESAALIRDGMTVGISGFGGGISARERRECNQDLSSSAVKDESGMSSTWAFSTVPN